MKLYYGWIIVLVNVVCATLVIGTVMSSFSLFVIPVSEDLGISRANVNSAFAIANIGNALAAPWIGRISDKYPVRPVLAISSVSLGLGLVLLSFTPSIWIMIFCLIILVPIGLDGTISITLNTVVSRWFRKLRARAMALAALGISLGGVLIPPVMAIIIDLHGWRKALLGAAIVLTAVLLLGTAMVRDRPGTGDVEPGKELPGADRQQTSASQPTLSIMDFLRDSRFWYLMVATSLVASATNAILISFVPIGVQGGLTAVEGATLISIASAAGILSKLVLASFGDRLDMFRLFIAAGLAGLLMSMGFMLGNSYAILLFCAGMLGISYGILQPIMQTLVVDIFGSASFGTARGLFAPIAAVANALCLRWAGLVYDRTGSYDHLYISLIILTGTAIVLMFLLRGQSTRSMRVQ